MVSTGVIIAAVVCCILVIIGTVLGVYFSGVACPDFGDGCTGSPGSPGTAGSPGSAGTAGSPGYRAPGAPGLQSLGSTADNASTGANYGSGALSVTCPTGTTMLVQPGGASMCYSCNDSTALLITDTASANYGNCVTCPSGYQMIRTGAKAGTCCLNIVNNDCACPSGTTLSPGNAGRAASCISCPPNTYMYPIGSTREGNCASCSGGTMPVADAAGNVTCPCPTGYTRLSNVPGGGDCFKCTDTLRTLQTDPSKPYYGKCVITQASATAFFSTPTTNPRACPSGQTLSGFGITSCIAQPATAARSTTSGACPYVGDVKVTEGANTGQCMNCGSPMFYDVVVTGADAGTCKSKFSFGSLTIT